MAVPLPIGRVFDLLHADNRAHQLDLFRQPVQLRFLVSDHSYLGDDRLDQVAFSFLRFLATYAVGRNLTFSELEYLRREGRRKLAGDGYKMRDCVLFVIESPLFLEK